VLLNYHFGRLVLSLLCVGDLVRLVLGGVLLQAEDGYINVRNMLST
jgi:hypothetical protein